MTSQHKLIAGTITLAVLAAAGAAFAAVKLDQSGGSTTRAVAFRPSDGLGGFGLGGRLGGRGFSGGVGPAGRSGNGAGGSSGMGFAFGLLGQELTSATGYLGLDLATVRGDLAKGQTLAEIAKTQGKSADGLVTAIVAAERKTVDSAVASGRLSKAQGQALESRLPQLVASIVNGTRPSGSFGRSFFGGPPGTKAPAAGATA